MDFKEVVKQLTDSEAMILTVYGEARGESIEGQVAVMNVIINRAHNRHLSIKEICFQPLQFSCWNANDPNFPVLKELAEKTMIDDIPDIGNMPQIKYLVAGVLGKYFPDLTHGSEYYMTTSLFHSEQRPHWALHPKREPIVIGNHTFLQV